MTTPKPTSPQTTTSVAEPAIKFLYVRDTACPERVLTIARRIVGDMVEMTFCCNKAELAATAHKSDGYRPRWVVMDRFEKAKARMITTARFKRADRVFQTPYRKGRVIEDALMFFASQDVMSDGKVPPAISRIARNALESKAS
jgi:hypothetical protein